MISALEMIHPRPVNHPPTRTPRRDCRRCKRFDTPLKRATAILGGTMLFAAKCYWPGVTEADLEMVARRAAPSGSATTANSVTYLGALLFTDDDLVLCLFDGPSRPAVKRASDHAGVPCERLMDSMWLCAGHRTEAAKASQ
jgi:hypothetical protein